MLNLPKWIIKRQSEQFLRALIETKAQVDEVTDKNVRRVLLEMRYKRAISPYTAIFKLTWEVLRGRYRKPFTKNNGDPDASSSGGAGAAGQPITQFTGFHPVNFTGFTAAGASPGGVAMPPPNPPAFFEDAGIKAGEIVAYRAWRLRNNKLYSVYESDFCWEPGTVCEGNAESGTGIHAFKSLLLLSEYGVSYSNMDVIVTGTVDLWGDVYEHDRGYRASKAAVRSIDDSPDYDAKALRRLYGLNKRKAKKKIR